MKPPGVFRVVHSADWHLGKTLGDLSREEEHGRFLEWLLEMIREREVDALVVAGDVFDSAYPPQSALRLYYSFLSEVYRTTSCAVVVVAGNHDSPAQLEAPKGVLGALRVQVVGAVTDDPGDALVVLPDEKRAQLVVAAVPFLRDRDLRTGEAAQSAAEIRKALAGGIAKRYEDVAKAAGEWVEKGVPVLATGHLTVANSKRSDSEREIHIGGLGSVNADIFPKEFDYVALGHLHRPQSADARGIVRYSGSPLPLSFGEAEDRKEVRVLDFEGGEMVNNEAVLVPVWRKLVQVRVKRAELGMRMEGLRNADCGLRLEKQGGGVEADGGLRNEEQGSGAGDMVTWVEVIVRDPIAGENLFEIVREMSEGKGFEVVRVVAEGGQTGGGIVLEMGGSGTEADDVLAEPERVFGMRLDGEEGLGAEEKEALLVAFGELVELHGQRQREEEDAHR